MDIWMLKKHMAKKDYTQETLAKAIGICSATFYRKVKNNSFTLAEAEEMIKLLDIKDPNAIFFDNEVT